MKRLLLAAVVVVCIASCRQEKVSAPSPVGPLPSPEQLAWHRMEMNAFIHFTTNTFTGLEWGYGDESPAIFNPSSLDAEQWVGVLKETGFKGVILTCKHHDGFCLWPSQYTSHSIKNSPYKNGEGDIVRAVSDACKKMGLKFGVYLSPWDRNHPQYGQDEYVTYYRNQLKEIFEHYGPVFEMWFDGANGGDGYYGGARTKRAINGAKYYDWPTTLDMVRSIEPSVIFFSDAGPGVRWVGNERGVAGETNWNLITPDTLFAGKAGIEQLLNSGSEYGTHWIPAETDVSIRKGWFYHPEEDTLVKSPERLFDIYLTSVGRGSTLLLNIPPDRRGLFHERDVASLKGFRKLLDETFAHDLARTAVVTASNVRGEQAQYSADNLIDGIDSTYWCTDEGVITSHITFAWEKDVDIHYVSVQEHIELGQRVKRFVVEAMINNEWKKIGEGTTIGYKRILKVTPVTTRQVRIRILDAKALPVLSSLAIY